MLRKPKGYVGLQHETIGSDILGIVEALHLPEMTLGKAQAEELKKVTADGWYPIGLLLKLLDTLDQKLGESGLRSLGWQLFRRSHEKTVKQKVQMTARELLAGFDGLYRRANRGQSIGGWEVKSFSPGRAELEKTTPHHCVLEEGILEEALRTIGVHARVSQTQCLRRGADSCHFLVTSFITDERWG